MNTHLGLSKNYDAMYWYRIQLNNKTETNLSFARKLIYCNRYVNIKVACTSNGYTWLEDEKALLCTGIHYSDPKIHLSIVVSGNIPWQWCEFESNLNEHVMPSRHKRYYFKHGSDKMHSVF